MTFLLQIKIYYRFLKYADKILAFKSRKQQLCQALADDVASNITILQYVVSIQQVMSCSGVVPSEILAFILFLVLYYCFPVWINENYDLNF